MPQENIEINKYPTLDDALVGAINELKKALSEELQKKRKILLLLSGGANLKVAQEAIELINNDMVTAYVLDERFSSDPSVNNSIQLSNLGINVCLTVPAETESINDFAERFDNEIRSWIENNHEGTILCTWGMGPDGHIAGISPMAESKDQFKKIFINTDKYVIGYSGNLIPPQRVTLTPSFITEKIDLALGFVTGDSKKEAWKIFLSTDVDENAFPVKILKRSKGQVIISTDLQ